MTKITIQDGKPRIVSGKVSVNQQDCCCDLEMPTTLTLTLSDAPEVFFHPRAYGTALPNPNALYGGSSFWPSTSLLQKCGRASTPMIEFPRPVYTRDDATNYVPGAMHIQDCTIDLELVSQSPGLSYIYEGYAPKPPSIVDGPPLGQPFNDSCVDCGGGLTEKVEVRIEKVCTTESPVSVCISRQGEQMSYSSTRAFAAATVEDGAVVSLTVVNGGSGYATLHPWNGNVTVDTPIVTFCSRSGAGASAEAVVDAEPWSPTFGKVVSLNLLSGGEGYKSEDITSERWTCTIVWPTYDAFTFPQEDLGLRYVHRSRRYYFSHLDPIFPYSADALGVDCCAEVDWCVIENEDRISGCPKPLLNREYGLALVFSANPYDWMVYHCNESIVGGDFVPECDLGGVTACGERVSYFLGDKRTAVRPPLTGFSCKLAPGPSDDCDTAWLEPLCDGSCPGDSTLMASLVSLEITSDCPSASGATGTVTIGCIPELKDGVILSASVTNGGSGYAQIKLTEPTLSLSAPGGTGAVLTVTKYTPFGEWFRIDSIAVADGGSGYTDNSQVIITLGENDEAFPQQATPDIRIRTMRPPNDEWTLTQWMYIPWLETWEQIPMVGTGLVISLTLAPTYEGSPFYNASSVNVVAGGSGYSVGEFLGVDAVEQGTEGGESVYGAFLEITSVGPGGAVTGFGILEAGRFAGIDTGVIHSIEFGSWRGAYRKRVGQACNVTVAVTQQPPSNGSGAIITAVIQNDPTKNGFGTITGLTVVNGGENYVARCCGNPLP